MFGQPLFAEMIFADIGSSVSINPGWDKIPVADCSDFDWKKIDRSCEEVRPTSGVNAEWTAIK